MVGLTGILGSGGSCSVVHRRCSLRMHFIFSGLSAAGYLPGGEDTARDPALDTGCIHRSFFAGPYQVRVLTYLPDNYSGMLIGLSIAILYFLGTVIRTSRLRVSQKVVGMRRRHSP
jgi:hypothetical protein